MTQVTISTQYSASEEWAVMVFWLVASARLSLRLFIVTILAAALSFLSFYHLNFQKLIMRVGFGDHRYSVVKLWAVHIVCQIVW